MWVLGLDPMGTIFSALHVPSLPRDWNDAISPPLYKSTGVIVPNSEGQNSDEWLQRDGMEKPSVSSDPGRISKPDPLTLTLTQQWRLSRYEDLSSGASFAGEQEQVLERETYKYQCPYANGPLSLRYPPSIDI